MKKEDLFEIIGDIDKQYIEEAYAETKIKKEFPWIKRGILAASIVLAVLAVPMTKYVLPQEEHKANSESLGIRNSKTESMQGETKEKAELYAQDIAIKDTTNTGVISGELPADENGEYHEAIVSEDMYYGEPQFAGSSSAEFFGGSYVDENGNFVIILTEDTPENRANICKELDVSESNTIFKKGKHTLEYLTKIQENITEKMVKKELPFVVSSGVYEMTNNIIVEVTTTDVEKLKKIYELDVTGEAIQVELSSGVITEELETVIGEAIICE